MTTPRYTFGEAVTDTEATIDTTTELTSECDFSELVYICTGALIALMGMLIGRLA